MRPKRTTKKSQPLSTTEILKELDEAVMKEEEALPVYASHIQSILFWSGLPPEKQQRVRESLAILLRDSAGHVKLLGRVKALYKQEVRSKRASK